MKEKAARHFLNALFDRATGPICVASYANARGGVKPVELVTLDGEKIISFIHKNDVPGRAVYVCVSTVKNGKRTKANADETVAIFVDLDFKGIAEPRKYIEKILKQLKLPPSMIVFTGHGLHGWWMLDVPCRDHEAVEALLKSMAWLLAGDPAVCEVSRVMRVPGTHNSKDKLVPVEIIHETDARYSMEQLAAWVNSHSVALLTYLEKDAEPPEDTRNFFEKYGDEHAIGEALDHDDVWSSMVYRGLGGGGNVHQTLVRLTASLLSRGMPVEEVIASVEGQVRERILEASSWDWKDERAKLRDLCTTWLTKNPELFDWQEHKPEWLLKDKRVKKALVKLAGVQQGAINGRLNGPGHRPVGGSLPPPENEPTASAGAPVDLWDAFPSAPLPRGVLPKVIEAYAFEQSRQMGSDAAGLAMGALVACAAVIPDSVKVQVTTHNPNWLESARLWVALVGDVSALKTPILTEVTREIRKIDRTLGKQSAADVIAWEENGKEGDKPPYRCIKIEDTTIEAAGEIAHDNPDGLLLVRDELSGWFGGMEKYTGNKNAGTDRAFWLQAYNGGDYKVNRIKRGALYIEHLSVSMLGGVQPKLIRLAADTGTDDGLIQRCNPVILPKSVLDVDEPISDEARAFDTVIAALHKIPRQFHGHLKFTEEAQVVRRKRAERNLQLRDCFATFNSKLAEHFGKYNGMFARLCVLFHCIENHAHGAQMGDIEADTAYRVDEFMERFMMPHAVAFYCSVLGFADNNDRLLAVAGYILSHKPEFVTNRDIQKSTRSMRGLDRRDTESVFYHLEALAWVTRISPKRAGDPPSWKVNPMVFKLYAGRGEAEKRQRDEVRNTLDGIFQEVRRERSGGSKWRH